MSEPTPDQRREQWRSDMVAGLWNRWYASGPCDLSRGWDMPCEGRHGPYALRIILAKADVRDLVAYIGAEHGNNES